MAVDVESDGSKNTVNVEENQIMNGSQLTTSMP
jgi:hypothetical protein